MYNNNVIYNYKWRDEINFYLEKKDKIILAMIKICVKYRYTKYIYIFLNKCII